MPIKYVETTFKTHELLSAKAQATGTIAIIGNATGGSLNTPIIITNTSDAIDTFGSGDLVDAIAIAFGQDPGPKEIWAVRESLTGVSYNEILLQDTGGNAEFDLSLSPATSITSVGVKSFPSLTQSSVDNPSDSTIYRQDGSACLLFAGITTFDTEATNIIVVVMDKNQIAVTNASVVLTYAWEDGTTFPSIEGTTMTDGAQVTKTTNDEGYVSFSISGYASTLANDIITISSVSGDLDSAKIQSGFTDKDGDPDNDVTFIYDGTIDTLVSRTSDSAVFWFSEATQQAYAMIFQQLTVTSITGWAGYLHIPDISDCLVDDATDGSNIGATGISTTIGLTGVGGHIATYSFSATDATWMSWLISKTGFEQDSFLDLTIGDTSTGTESTDPALIVADGDGWTNVGLVESLPASGKYIRESPPVLHTYQSVSGMTEVSNTLIRAVSIAPISFGFSLEYGKIYLSETIGIDDHLYVVYVAGALASALGTLEHKEFKVAALAGHTSKGSLRTFTRFVESRKSYLPTYGVFALDYKSLESGNGADYAMSKVAQSNYIGLFAHDDPLSEVASAVCGAVVSVQPWFSTAFVTVQKITNTNEFTNTELNSYAAAQINVLDSVLYFDSISPAISWGYSTGSRRKADIQMTLNFIDVEIKRTVSNPKIIGRLPISANGIKTLKASLDAILQPLIEINAIGATSKVVFPLLSILIKPASSRNAVETVLVSNAQNTRRIVGEVQIDYQGSIETIELGVRMF